MKKSEDKTTYYIYKISYTPNLQFIAEQPLELYESIVGKSNCKKRCKELNEESKKLGFCQLFLWDYDEIG